MNQGGYVTLTGFVATEPRINVVKNGLSVVHMRIGSTARKLDRETGEWQDGETSFYSVSAWRSLASNAVACLHKGLPVIVAGKLRSKQYADRNGQAREEVQVDAEAIGIDLRRGVATFTRTPRPTLDAAALARGEAIRAGLVDGGPDGPGTPRGAGATGHGEGDDGAEMFGDEAIAELEHELDASAAKTGKTAKAVKS